MAKTARRGRTFGKPGSGSGPRKGRGETGLEPGNMCGLSAGNCEQIGPSPDPELLERTCREFVQDWGPRDSIERRLVEQAAWLEVSLRLARRQEDQTLAEAARAGRKAELLGEELAAVELGRRLFAMGRHRPWELSGDPELDRPPAADGLKLRLEATAAGCRYLLARWAEFANLLDCGAEWDKADRYGFCRLLGKEPVRATIDPELNRAILAWEALAPGAGVKFWADVRDSSSQYDPAFCQTTTWRAVVPRPADAAEARAELGGIIGRETRRLEAALEAHRREEGAGSSSGRVGPEAAAMLEKSRRMQAARVRELRQMLDGALKLRKERLSETKAAARPGPGPVPVPKEAAGPRRPKSGGEMPLVSALLTAMFESGAARDRIEREAGAVEGMNRPTKEPREPAPREQTLAGQAESAIDEPGWTPEDDRQGELGRSRLRAAVPGASCVDHGEQIGVCPPG